MSEKKSYPMPVADAECDWIGHPDGNASTGSPDFAIYDGLVKGRDRIVVHAESMDGGSYEYSDKALIELDGQFYLLTNSGCSCPSPSETWVVEAGPDPDIERVRRYYETNDGAAYKRELLG